MKALLASRNAAALARFAASPGLVGLDFDGTLAPLVADRDRAVMRPATQRLLTAVCERYPCAIISGRARADVAARLGDARVIDVIGNHGAEIAGASPRHVAMMRPISVRLRHLLGRQSGVDIEDKGATLALHYRGARHRDTAASAIATAIATLPAASRRQVRIVAGVLVVNVVPRGAPDKGVALRRLCRTHRLARALYVGDDVTDEDVFTATPRGLELLTVRVGVLRRSAATYFLRDQAAIDELLERLLALRADPARRGIMRGSTPSAGSRTSRAATPPPPRG